MRHFVLLTLVALVISCTCSEQANAQEVPEGELYIYKKSNGVDRQIEIHFPEGHDAAKKAVPGIIMFHGGGWSSGNRKQFRDLCHYFASRGLVAATVTYQLASKQKVDEGSRKRVCITDAKSAIRWFKQNAADLGVDPEKIVAGGGSAGGHIALLASNNADGLDDPQDSSEVDTAVAAYLLFNPAFQGSDKKDPEVDFLKHLEKDIKPSIVFFGSKDKWLKGWKPVHKKMKKQKATVNYFVAEGQEHGFFNKKPWAKATFAACDQFLSELSLIEGEPTIKAPPANKLIKQ